MYRLAKVGVLDLAAAMVASFPSATGPSGHAGWTVPLNFPSFNFIETLETAGLQDGKVFVN